MDVDGEITRLRDRQDHLTGTLHQMALQHVELQGSVQATTSNVDRLAETVSTGFRGLEQKFAPLARFEIVEKAFLGGCGLILAGVLAAWLAGTLRESHPQQQQIPLTPPPAQSSGG